MSDWLQIMMGRIKGFFTEPGLKSDEQVRESPAGTMVFGPGSTIVNQARIVWAITANRQITRNGRLDPNTKNVSLLYYRNQIVYQENNQGDWWYYKPSAAYPWAPVACPIGISANGSTTPSASLIVDTKSETWWLNSNAQVVRNGAVDSTTANANLILLWNAVIYHRNKSNNWYRWNP